jgi:hypothetical protein
MKYKAFLMAVLIAASALPALANAQRYGYPGQAGGAQRSTPTQNDDDKDRGGNSSVRGGGGRPPVRGNDSLGAFWGPQQDRAREGVRHGGQVSLSRVIAIINGRMPGRVLDAGLESYGGRQVYRVRWLTQDGRRLDFLVDAATGVIVGQ